MSDLVRHLIALRHAHRSLDETIDRLSQSSYYNELELKRMKKRRLELKDAISKLESRRIPDLNA